MYCPQCGNEVTPGDRFCGRCGYDLAGNSEAGTSSNQEPQAVAPDEEEPQQKPTSTQMPAPHRHPQQNPAPAPILAQQARRTPRSAASQSRARFLLGLALVVVVTAIVALVHFGTGRNVDGTADSSAYLVQADDYQFELPEYWRGKVDVTVDGDNVTISPSGLLRTSDDGLKLGVLASISVVPQSDEQVSGDIGSHLVYSDETVVPGYRIEVWTQNWPWFAASGGYPATEFTTDELATLVDLSTGGSLSYDQAVSIGPDDESVSMAEFNYSQNAFSSIFSSR